MSSYERDRQAEELARRFADRLDNAADEPVLATLVPQRMVDPKVEPPKACRCGFAWASIEGGTAEDYCHHTWPNGSEEWLVVCPRCRADGPLKASAEWAIAAWDEQSRLTHPVEALRAISSLAREARGSWKELVPVLGGIADAALAQMGGAA